MEISYFLGGVVGLRRLRGKIMKRIRGWRLNRISLHLFEREGSNFLILLSSRRTMLILSHTLVRLLGK
jgi:hypothetical protein